MSKKKPTPKLDWDTDYHNFSGPHTPASKRVQLNIGDIYCNAVECPECGYYIRSRNRHDMVTCKCEGLSIDGGSWYTKLSGRNASSAISRIILFDDAKKSV